MRIHRRLNIAFDTRSGARPKMLQCIETICSILNYFIQKIARMTARGE